MSELRPFDPKAEPDQALDPEVLRLVGELELQFGTSDNDFGADVAYPASGRVHTITEQEGYIYDE